MSEASVALPPLRLALLGSPNSGKTTLFNALTGGRARVGNYPGVTVERREGALSVGARNITVIDLPGSYSLDSISADEEVVNRVVAGAVDDVEAPDALVAVADACSIERSLLFIGQVLRLGKPTCLVLTMLDELHARGGALDVAQLERALSIPIVGVIGHKGIGLDNLRARIGEPEAWERPLLDPPAGPLARAAWADSILQEALRRPGHDAVTEAIDRFVLHPVFGTMLFAFAMVLFFQLIFSWAVPLMDLIDGAFGAATDGLRASLPPGLLVDFIAQGLIGGVGAVVVFVPQIGLLFAVLYLLEDLGYMARAAFVVDRVMGRVGLEGRCFVSLLSSYACALPGMMATRTIPSPTQRLITILVSPLMTCSARLPVYALLIGAFVPASAAIGPFGMQGLALLGLYLLGSGTALVVAAILRRTLLAGEGLPFFMELPPYRIPTLRLWASQTWGSVKAFLKRAGSIILGVSIVLWVLFQVPRVPIPTGMSEADAASYALEHSVAGRLGHGLEPVIAPLGFDWKIGIGLIGSLAAREVIVSTLGQIYAATDEEASLREAIRRDRRPDGTPVYTTATVASLLVFFVFALQCMSTVAVMRRETNSWRWPAFAFSYMLVLAWSASFATHRLVTWLA